MGCVGRFMASFVAGVVFERGWAGEAGGERMLECEEPRDVDVSRGNLMWFSGQLH